MDVFFEGHRRLLWDSKRRIGDFVWESNRDVLGLGFSECGGRQDAVGLRTWGVALRRAYAETQELA